MKKIYNWLVQSSVNPQALSLTIKGFIPLLVFLGADNADLNVFADSLTQVIIDAGKFASSVIFVVGLLRKIALSFK